MRKPVEERKLAQDSAHASGQKASAVVQLSGPRAQRPKPSARRETGSGNVETHIGRQLKAVYDDVLNQPIPDRFLDLLSQLENKAGTSGRKQESEES